MDPVEVRYRGRSDVLVARGGRLGDVVGFRWGFSQDGREVEQTSFVLVDEGFLLAQPALFTGDRAGWWYCDLVTVDDAGDTVTIEDLYVDVLVGPPTAPYRVLDLDELAEAVSTWPDFPPAEVLSAGWSDLPRELGVDPGVATGCRTCSLTSAT